MSPLRHVKPASQMSAKTGKGPTPGGAAGLAGPPVPVPGLEEAVVRGGPGASAGLGFHLARLTASPRPEGAHDRLVALVTPGAWTRERGRVLARGAQRYGIDPERWLFVRVEKEAQALWALEEILRAGAADLVLGMVEQVSLTQSRRLDMAARDSGATVALLKTKEEAVGLSCARRRWRVSPLPSAPHRWDPRAPGAPRWRAELTRRRDGPTGAWNLEWNDETGRLDLVEGLAGDGLGEGARQVASG